MTPTDLDIALGDLTTIPEETAWGAFQTLKAARTDPALAADPNLSKNREALQSYVTERRSNGHELFPNVTAAANRQRNDTLAALYTKPLEEALPGASFSEIERRAAFTADPEEFKQRQVNRSFLSATLGRNITAEEYPFIRQIYAKQHLGLDKDTSEKAVFSALQTRFTEEATSQKTLTALAKQAFTETLEGKPRTAPDLSAIPPRLRENVAAEISRTQREAARQKRQLRPTVDTITKELSTFAKELEGAPAELELTFPFEKVASALPRDPKQKQLALALVAMEIRNLPDFQKGGAQRFQDSVIRGLFNAGISAVSLPLEIGAKLRAALPAGQEFKRTAQDNETIRRDAQTLRRMLIGEIDPAVKATDGLVTKSLILAGGSAWTLPAVAAGPAGWAAMASAFGGDSYQQAREENPDASRDAQLFAAAASGVVQAGAETVLTKVGFKVVGGKIPGLAGILNKSGVLNPLARGTIAAAAGGATITATEYTEEALQGATDRLAQDLALEFSNIAPSTDWKQFWGKWLTVGGQEQRDTLLAIMPFAVVGAGGGSMGHFKYGSHLARNRALLDAVGVPEAKIREIVRSTDVEKTDSLIKEAFAEGLEARTAEQKAAARETLREQNRLITAAGLPRITKESEYTFTFTDPVSGESSEFETEEEALAHWRDAALQQNEAALETIANAAREGSLDFLTAEGKVSNDTRVQETDVVMSFPRAVKEGIITREQLEARLQSFILQEGMSAADAVNATESLVIRARSYTEATRDGQLRYTVQLFKGADALNIFEDFAEDAMKRAISAGIADPLTILADLRDYQTATGDTILPAGYEYDPDNAIPLIEAFSALARAQVIGNVSTDSIPRSVGQWLETITTYGEHTLATAKDIARGYAPDLQRTATLREAIGKGTLPPRLLDLINDSIGINEKETFRRMEKAYEEQLMAEAMGGFPEIQAELQGRIPHPQTLRDNQHPLAGEVRRIWESMKKPTRRRDSQGRQIDRTNEANAYFLPIGKMVDLDKVREAMNAKGFDFQTPADLLDALDSSVSYNKPFYGTASRGNDSFSIGRVNLPPTTQESREVSSTAPVADLTADSGTSPVSNAFLFQSAPSEPGDASPRGDGETNSSFSIGRARENYEKAQNRVLYAKKELSEVEEATAEERKEWEEKHGKIVTVNSTAKFRQWFPYKNFTPPKNDYTWQFTKNVNGVTSRGRGLSRGYEPHPEVTIFTVDQNGIETHATKIIDNHGKTLFEISTFDHKPFPESKELIAAREALAQAEAELYLAEEEFDPANAPDPNDTSPDPVPAAGSNSVSNELQRKRDIYNAMLDARAVEEKNAARSFIARVWSAYAQHDELFQFGRSNSKDAAEIAKAVSSPGKLITVVENGDSIRLQGKNGYISIEDAETTRPYISAPNAGSKGKKEGGGSQLYAIALDWIHNNKKRVKDDRGGLSHINWVRRTSNMAASAIRWGTTRHLKPHANQEVGKWTTNDLFNTSLLITKEMENTHRILPQSKALRYDFASDTFTRDGHAVTTEELATLIEDTLSFDKGIGLSTLQRAVITASAIDEFQRGTAESIVQQAESDLPASLTGVSYSLGPASLNRIEAAIARKLTAAPDERAEFYSRVRNRLAGLTQRLEDMENGLGPFARKPTDEAGEERRRIQDAIAEARAIISSLPIEARGRVDFDFEDITAKTTEKGRVKALLRLIDKADVALEVVLKKEYLEAFSRTLDLAAPELRQNRAIRGRLTPETQRLINAIIPIVHLTQTEAQAATIQAQAAYDAIEAQYPDPTDDAAVTAWESALASAQETLDLLNTFASLTSQTAAEIAEARKHLLQIYTKGRTARQMLDQAKRSETASQRREVIESLGGMVSQSKWAKRTEKAGFADLAESFRLGLASFHEVMEWLFPKSIAARDYQQAIRDSERAFTRAKIDARERFENFAYTAFNLTGKSRKRKLNRIIAALSTRRDDWNIEIAEGTRFETEKMTEEQAAGVLDGTIKPGWEGDPIAMESLRQSLADFRLQRQTARDSAKAFTKKVVKFQRLTQRGAPTFLRMSDMEAVYWLQLAAQEQYLPALDRYGFTPAVIAKIRAKLDPRAETFASHLRKEYDAQWGRLNPVHQRLFGLDMPRIRNYAPGMFDSMDSKGDPNIGMDGAAGSVNAMTAGFTKARVHHMARPRQMNALAAYWSSLESTEYFIAWAETMRDMRQVFRSPDVRRVIEGNYGTRAARDFSTWLDTLETDGRARALEAIGLSELTTNTLTTQSAVGLAFNLGTVFKQWSAGLGHFMHIPTTQAIKVTFQALADPASLRAAWGNEAVQQRILAGITPEDKRLMDAANASPSLAMELLDLGRLPIALADAAFTSITGAAAYKYQYQEAVKAGLSDSQAHAAGLTHLDFVITRTAQPATTQDKSLAENSAKGFAKFLFLFKSDPRQKFAKAASALRLMQRGDITKVDAARRIVFSWMVYGLMAQVATDIWLSISRDDDDEENWKPQDYAAAMIAGPLSGIPLMGAALETTIKSLVGSKAYTNNANPIDKAVSYVFRDGFTLATVKAASAEEIDLSEILAAATRDAGSISQILGTYTPAFAIIPAGLRAVRDAVGIGSNVIGAFTPESEEEIASRIIREERKASRKETTGTTEDLEAITADLLRLDPAARAKRLAALDKDTRARVEPRLRRAAMSPNERALSSMSLAQRKAAVEKILEALPEARRQPFIDRLEEIGINLPD